MKKKKKLKHRNFQGFTMGEYQQMIFDVAKDLNIPPLINAPRHGIIINPEVKNEIAKRYKIPL